MSLVASLRAHISLCEEIHELMLEENRFVKNASRPPGEKMLSRKRTMLDSLVRSLAELRAACTPGGAITAELRALMQTAQQTILKGLLLDRENEQLLLKITLQPRPVPVSARPANAHLQRVYGQRS